MQDVTDTLSGRRAVGWQQKFERAHQDAGDLLNELRVQAQRATRQDAVLCELRGSVCSGLAPRLY